MIRLAFIALVAVVTLSVAAEDLDWQKLKAERPATPGELVPNAAPGGRSALLLENNSSQPRVFELALIADPKVVTVQYQVSGMIRYEGIEGDGFLELRSHFGKLAFFTRTWDESGPMGKLRGTSGWREFVLPFDSTGAAERLTQLDVYLHLPGKGKVWIGPLSTPGATGLTSNSSWWSDSAGGWIGGIAGSILGLLAALCAWLVSRGKARGFVLGVFAAMIAVGALMLAGGVTAAILHQPYAVYYPLLLLGGLSLAFGIVRLQQARRKHADDDYRKMLAADA